MRILLATLALLLALSSVQAQQQRITEDDPRWDCHTMGNKVCGYELEPLYVTRHAGHFDATTMAGVVLSEFETRAQLQRYAQEHGFKLVYMSYQEALAQHNQPPKPVYYCNAVTKKGTPCRHRVKVAGERCWMHKGK